MDANQSNRMMDRGFPIPHLSWEGRDGWASGFMPDREIRRLPTDRATPGD